MINHEFLSLSAVQIYDLSCIHLHIHLVEQAQGYLINAYLFRSALTERKPKGVPSHLIITHTPTPKVGL